MLYEVVSRRIVIDKKTGNDKSVTEKFIVKDEELCAGAEQRMLEYYNGENECILVKQCGIREIINERSDETQSVYLATIEEVFVGDEGSEKTSKYVLALFSGNIEEATQFTSDFLKQGLEDFRLISMKRTKIIDII